jgi:AraC-like DNA-binding protein
MEQLRELAGLIARHAPEDGICESPVPRLALIRSSTSTLPQHGVYEPALCIVAQGSKRVMVGDRVYIYDPATFLIVSVDLPVMGHVLEASEEEPYLCLRLNLDLQVLSELMLSHGGECPGVPGTTPGLALSRMTPGLLDSAVRLLRLLDTPTDIPALVPLAEREILYRLLTGEQGGMVRHIATAESRLSQISRAIAWIKDHYASPFNVERVAAEAGMSASSFHHHFKAITSMSPLQYRTHMRLQEARRLMVAEALDAASAGFRVGYESPSQFSRDYKRVFGAPPLRHAVELRTSPEYVMA